MTRLTWNNVTAPDLARTSQIIHSAGESFQDGLTRASEILSEYDLGQKEKNDQALLSEVAALNSEEELANFLKSDRLTGLNISSEMRESILDLRQNILNADQTRANTGLTRANIGLTNAKTGLTHANIGLTNANIDQTRANIGLINANIGLRGAQTDETRANIGLINANTDRTRAQVDGIHANTRLTNANTADVLGRLGLARAADARTQADWESENRKKDELKKFTGRVVDGVANGLANGFSNGSGNMAEIEAAGRAGNFSTQASMLQAAVIKQESGGDPEIVSPVGATGIMQLMPETAMNPGFGVRNIFEHARSLGVPVMGETPEIADALMRNPQVNAQMGHEYLTAMLKRYNGDVARALVAYNWGPGNADNWDGNIASLPGETQGYLRNIIGNVSGGGKPNIVDGLRNSTELLPADALRLFYEVRKAKEQGQDIIDEQNRAKSRERLAADFFNRALDPTITSNSEFTTDLMKNGEFTSDTERMDALKLFNDVTANNKQVSDLISPTPEINQFVASGFDTNIRRINREYNALPQTPLLELAGSFANGDVAENLIAHLELGDFGEDPRTYFFGFFGEKADKNSIEKHIRSIASQAGVTPEIAAVAMAEIFDRDPFGINTAHRRFNEEEAIEFIKNNLSPEAINIFDNLRNKRDIVTAELNSAYDEYKELKAEESKHINLGREVPDDLAADIRLLGTLIINGFSPEMARRELQTYIRKTGIAQRLESLDSNSEDYIIAIKQLEENIRTDDELSPDKKKVLLAMIQG